MLDLGRLKFFNVVYAFPGGANGANSFSTLISDSSGNLYGTCFHGGAFGFGNVFMLSRNGTETVLYSFTGGRDGANPPAGVIRDGTGNLYGTTSGGGTYGLGTVFKLDPQGAETVLHSFAGVDGEGPDAGLAQDEAGNLYGTTFAGGSAGSQGGGVVFKISSTGEYSVLHNFAGGSDGHEPEAPVVLDQSGNLYGTTNGGGAGAEGTVFKVDASGTETILYSFPYDWSTGAQSQAGLLLRGERLYGTTSKGGTYGYGVLFKIGTSGSFSVVHNFTADEGAGPAGALAEDTNGTIYGAAAGGGTFDYGTVFSVNSDGAATVLHTFNADDGAFPYGGVLLTHGVLFGTTEAGARGPKGCQGGCGVAFKLKP